MKKSVLILSAGGPSGISCIKVLRRIENLHIVAADKSEYAAGLQYADISVVIPPTQDEGFLGAIEDIISRYHVDILMPSFETGIKKLSGLMRNFGLDNTSSLVCQDKLTFFDACTQLALPVPDTKILTKNLTTNSFPKYIKPRVGSTSINNFTVRSQHELDGLLNVIDLHQDYLIQDYLTGEHWNVDVHVDNGIFITAVPRRDIFQNSGQCITVEVRNYQSLIEFSQEIQSKLNILSPFNLEVFEVEPRKFVMNEINVRFGGGIIFSVMAGVDMISHFATKDRRYLSDLRDGTYTRFYEEVLVDKMKVSRFYDRT